MWERRSGILCHYDCALFSLVYSSQVLWISAVGPRQGAKTSHCPKAAPVRGAQHGTLGGPTDSHGQDTGGFAHMHHDVKQSNKGRGDVVRCKMSGRGPSQTEGAVEQALYGANAPRVNYGASPRSICLNQSFSLLSLVQNMWLNSWREEDFHLVCNIVCASALHLCKTCTGFVIVDVGRMRRINVNCH